MILSISRAVLTIPFLFDKTWAGNDYHLTPVPANKTAALPRHAESETDSSVQDRADLIKLAEEEVLAIETQYELTNPRIELSDISENTELTNELISGHIIEEVNVDISEQAIEWSAPILRSFRLFI